MYNFSFLCRPSKANKNNLSPIELSIIINSKRTYVALPMKFNSTDFAKKMGSKRNNEVIEYTSAVRLKLNRYINEMMQNDIAITADSLKELFLYGGTKSYTLSQLLQEFLKYIDNKTANCRTNVTRKYELAFNRLIAHCGDIEVSKVTFVHIENLKAIMAKEMEASTLAHTLTKIKAVFEFAVNMGKIKSNPFFKVTIERKAKEVEKLDDEEVHRIVVKEFSNDRLNRIKDIFLFQIYTGLAYADMSNLKQDDIQYEDGMYFVRKNRQKTEVTFFSVIGDEAMAILRKYDYQLPILSNQKYNAYLKEIADLCNINKPLHTHIARHTCATRLLNQGMPLEIVAKVLGHTNTRQTQHYAKLMDKTVLRAFKDFSK